MKTIYQHGIIIGKFMPFHLWHEALIEFGAKYSECLSVCVCSNPSEDIPGELRYQRVVQHYADIPTIKVVHITDEIPRNGRNIDQVAKDRADYLIGHFPTFDAIISSETYGDIIAHHLWIQHLCFDAKRSQVPISATQIRQDPVKYQQYLNRYARAYFLS